MAPPPAEPWESLPEDVEVALASCAVALSEAPRAAGSAALLSKVLRNVVTRPGEAKFRRVRLDAPRPRAAIAEVPQALEILELCGFVLERDRGEGEGRGEGRGEAAPAPASPPALVAATLPPGASLAAAREALSMLDMIAARKEGEESAEGRAPGADAAGGDAVGGGLGAGPEGVGEAPGEAAGEVVASATTSPAVEPFAEATYSANGSTVGETSGSASVSAAGEATNSASVSTVGEATNSASVSAAGSAASAELSRLGLASARGGRGSSGAAASPPPPPASPSPSSCAPRPRKTRVAAPSRPETSVPSWFFERTGKELLQALRSDAARREQERTLMTRAMRERLASGRRDPEAERRAELRARYALVRVRLPEGLLLEGEFGAAEPVAAVRAWISDCLADPLSTYDLVGPDRRPVAEPGARQTVARAGLVPSAVLNLRWVGDSVREMTHRVALRSELLREIG